MLIALKTLRPKLKRNNHFSQRLGGKNAALPAAAAAAAASKNDGLLLSVEIRCHPFEWDINYVFLCTDWHRVIAFLCGIADPVSVRKPNLLHRSMNQVQYLYYFGDRAHVYLFIIVVSMNRAPACFLRAKVRNRPVMITAPVPEFMALPSQPPPYIVVYNLWPTEQKIQRNHTKKIIDSKMLLNIRNKKKLDNNKLFSSALLIGLNY